MKRAPLIILAAAIAVSAAGLATIAYVKDEQYRYLPTIKWPEGMTATYSQQKWNGTLPGICLSGDLPCPLAHNGVILKITNTHSYPIALEALTAKLHEQGIEKGVIQTSSHLELEPEPDHPGKMISKSWYTGYYVVPKLMPGCNYLYLNSLDAPTDQLDNPSYWQNEGDILSLTLSCQSNIPASFLTGQAH